MAEAAPMNGGVGKYSYAKNSHFQRDAISYAKNLFREVLIENLDVKSLVSSNSSTFRIVDLGCSVGPNTFFAMEIIMEAIENKFQSQVLNSTKVLEFQIFFNDRADNDFNTLFASLPLERQYFVAGVPGSFHGRLFPTSSIHIAYSSASIHWLSKVPNKLLDRNSPAYNRGKIHYTGASDQVVKAYADQFERDMEVFLCARNQEIVKGGMIVIHMPGVADGTVTHEIGIFFTFLESILEDMIKEDIVKQDEIDAFNIPHVYPSVTQMSRIVEKNGYFEIEKMEFRNAINRTDTYSAVSYLENVVMNIRAATEGTFSNYFDSKIVDEVFKRAMQQKSKLSHMVNPSHTHTVGALFVVLKRK